jgi:hypothetical protein
MVPELPGARLAILSEPPKQFKPDSKAALTVMSKAVLFLTTISTLRHFRKMTFPIYYL